MSQLKTIAERRTLMVPIDDDSENEMFHADFMYDGAKYSRGGKHRFMFKHQPRRKYHRYDHRYDQRQRSSARMRQG